MADPSVNADVERQPLLDDDDNNGKGPAGPTVQLKRNT
jgi:hypothetical protein